MKTEVRELWWLRQGTGTLLLLSQDSQLILSTAPGKSLGQNAEAES